MNRTRIKTCRDLIDTAEQTIESVGQYVNIQLMGNADISQTAIDTMFPEAPLAKREEYRQLLELIIKKPFRRQYGRMRAIARSLAELQKILSEEEKVSTGNQPDHQP